MIYVLIFVWQSYAGGAPATATSVEMGSMSACQAAATEIRKQATKDRAHVPLLLCAAKGEKS